MAYKSNITVASNIYSRISSDEKSDPNFVASIHNGDALRELDRRLFGQGNVKLNEIQQYELSESIACSTVYNYLHEMTHGPIKRSNEIIWSCRCENVNCINYSSCMPVPIVRTFETDCNTDTPASSDLEYEWLGVVDNIFSEPEDNEQSFEIEDEPVPQEFVEPPIVSGDYIELATPAEIIEADINSQILVNAGPGTGKTYTVIERLTHIINSGYVDLDKVLVLCYTNAARDVILGRLDEKGLGAEARQLVICTLDSLAWYNLSEKTEDDLFALGYNGCIHRFNTEFDESEWSWYEYVIIDELQDLVNARARMTLKILKALNCGYLLLGDKCQAIYDYDCKGTDGISSVKFYEELELLLPATAKRYELIGNKRQSNELSRWASDLRDALLSFDVKDANWFFYEEISNLTKGRFIADTFSSLSKHSTTAILTRNNGEAEWVSALLHKANIRHSLLRSVSPRPSLNRFIADVFWDYRESHISCDEFIERYMIRVKADELCAKEAYDALTLAISAETDANNEYIEIAELYDALKKGQNLSPVLINVPSAKLTVSTIHKAKGREFDRVYMMGEFTVSEENTEEARVWYVGSTRPKTELDVLSRLKIYVSKPSPMNRRLRTGYKRGRYKMNGTRYCSNIVIGLPQDVDNYSFISGDLSHAIEIQRYLSESLEVNDSVELIKNSSIYVIFHKGNAIGTLSGEATSDFLAVMRKINKWSALPPRLTEVYISDIVTVIPWHFPRGADSMFKDSKFWLGIELTGFAKADWDWRG